MICIHNFKSLNCFFPMQIYIFTTVWDGLTFMGCPELYGLPFIDDQPFREGSI